VSARGWDALWINVHLATIDEATGLADGYGTIRDGALAMDDGRIAWVGPRRDLPSGWRAEIEHDGKGGWLTPGLIDCHTHLVMRATAPTNSNCALRGLRTKTSRKRAAASLRRFAPRAPRVKMNWLPRAQCGCAA